MYDMKVGKDTLVFNAYFDYYYDTVNLAQVYLTNQQVRKIKKASIPNQRGKQILFLHDQNDYFLNIMGYYYSDLLLNEIELPRKVAYEKIPLTQGLGFHYLYDQKPVSEFYIPYQSGILRFIAVGDHNWHKTNSNRFHSEIDYIFYVINGDLFRLKPNDVDFPSPPIYKSTQLDLYNSNANWFR